MGHRTSLIRMGKIIIINVLLFIVGIVLFVAAAVGIEASMGADKHIVETALAYIAIVVLHLVVNARLLKKWQRNTATTAIISTALIIGAYVAYLFIYR